MEKIENLAPEGDSSAEEIKQVRSLLIDDYPSIVTMMNYSLQDVKDFLAVQCNTVESAMAEIYKYQPKKLFLDHNLTSTLRGPAGEGLEIAKRVQVEFPETKFFLISTDETAVEKYLSEGVNIKYINKGDSRKLKMAITT